MILVSLQVLCWTLLMGIVSYIRLAITSIFRELGGKSLVHVGALTQLGSFIGAIVIFLMIQFTDTFTSYYLKC